MALKNRYNRDRIHEFSGYIPNQFGVQIKKKGVKESVSTNVKIGGSRWQDAAVWRQKIKNPHCYGLAPKDKEPSLPWSGAKR